MNSIAANMIFEPCQEREWDFFVQKYPSKWTFSVLAQLLSLPACSIEISYPGHLKWGWEAVSGTNSSLTRESECVRGSDGCSRHRPSALRVLCWGNCGWVAKLYPMSGQGGPVVPPVTPCAIRPKCGQSELEAHGVCSGRFLRAPVWPPDHGVGLGLIDQL